MHTVINRDEGAADLQRKLVFHVFATLAEFECDLARERTASRLPPEPAAATAADPQS